MFCFPAGLYLVFCTEKAGIFTLLSLCLHLAGGGSRCCTDAGAHLARLKSPLSDASRGRCGQDMVVKIQDAARNSIGSRMPAKSLELQHTLRLIRELDVETREIESEIQAIMDEMHSRITTITGIGCCMGAMILAGTGDF